MVICYKFYPILFRIDQRFSLKPYNVIVMTVSAQETLETSFKVSRRHKPIVEIYKDFKTLQKISRLSCFMSDGAVEQFCLQFHVSEHTFYLAFEKDYE